MVKRVKGGRLSINAYAKHRKKLGLSGGSNPGVVKAIKTGRIEQAVGDDGLIDPALADTLWEQNTRPKLETGGAQHRPEDKTARKAALAFAIARAQHERAKARLARDELLINRGLLKPAEDWLPLFLSLAEKVDGALRSAPREKAKAWSRRLGVTQGEALDLLRGVCEDVRALIREIVEDQELEDEPKRRAASS